MTLCIVCCVNVKPLKSKLKCWIKETCSNLQKDIAKVKEKLNVVQTNLSIVGVDHGLEMEEKKLLSEYRLLTHMESLEMQQKAEREWNLSGEKCSRYFHKFLKEKKNRSTNM